MLNTSVQEQGSTFRVLNIPMTKVDFYPELSLDFEYYTLSDMVSPDAVVLFENSRKTQDIRFRFNKEKSIFIRQSLADSATAYIKLTGDVSWTSPDPMSLNQNRTVLLTIGESSKTTEISIPDTLLKGYFIDCTNDNIDSLVLKKDYTGGIRLINNRYKLLPAKIFIAKAAGIFEDYSTLLLDTKNQTPFSEYMDLESLCEIPLDSTYYVNKRARVEEFYNLIDTVDNDYKERLLIAEFLVNEMPDNNVYKYRLHRAKAQLAESKGQHWEALDQYHLAFQIIRDEGCRNEITRLINKCLPEAYNMKDWVRLRRYGAAFSEFIDNSIRLRYYYGRGCYEYADYNSAIGQFEWLVFNWTDNEYLTWNNAFNYLQDSYMHSFNFDKAVNLSQRIFMERGDIESLNLALLNLRLSWLKTIVESFDLWLEALPGSYNNSEQVSFTRIIIPDYIRGIYLTDIQDGSMNVLYTNTSSDVQDLKIPSSKESLPRIVIDRMHHWIVSSQCGNKSVALLIDNRIMDEQEKYLLSSIGREPSDSKLWELLTAYEEESGARLLAQFGTLLAGATMGIKGNKEVDCFGNLLLNRGDIAYVIYQNPDGIIEYNNGFDNKKAEYNNNDWQKSSRTTALYIIELKYENKNTREITNPVFKNNRWEGVLRIGMLKQ